MISMGDYELYHHGIKGQKWGIRRTAAQLGHRVAKAASVAGRSISKAGKAAGKAIAKSTEQHRKEAQEKRYYKKLKKKRLSQMTDKEIADLTKRVKVEAGLKDAQYESRVQNARKFYKNVAQQPVNSIATIYAKEAVKKHFGGDD